MYSSKMSFELGFPQQQEDNMSCGSTLAVAACAVSLVVASVLSGMKTGTTHQDDIKVSDDTTVSSNTKLTDPILAILSESGNMSAKDILKKLKSEYPEITKKDVNSNLYKMLGKKLVSKDASTCPMWRSA